MITDRVAVIDKMELVDQAIQQLRGEPTKSYPEGYKRALARESLRTLEVDLRISRERLAKLATLKKAKCTCRPLLGTRLVQHGDPLCLVHGPR